nr:hypothetical protein [Tanacetum cinerariifolium]
GDYSSKSSAGPSRKICRSPAATMILSIHAKRALVPSRDDLLPPRKRFRDSISLEDSVKEDIDTVVDRGTMEVGLDVVVGIDIPGAMLMPDVGKHLEQVEEGLQDIYKHVMEIPLQRI